MRRLVRCAALLAMSFLLASCPSSASKSKSTPTATVAISRPTASLSAVPAHAPRCMDTQLSVAYEEQVSEGATGQNTRRFVIQNFSRRACVLLGYPGVVLIDAAGRA